MQEIALSTRVLFMVTTLITYYWVIAKFKPSRNFSLLITLWLCLQGFLAYQGFYENNNTTPPRFILMVLPPLLLIVLLFNVQKGKAFIDAIPIHNLTQLHIIRIPVELVLYALYLAHYVPLSMTFSGINFDIFSGISAPLIYLITRKNPLKWSGLLIGWNLICLILLLIIVVTAVLSAPSPFQQMAFDQPNKGVLLFPFNWLPSFIVPVVFFSHLCALRQLLFNRQKV